jgi:pyruvate-formate lyase
MKYFWFYLIKQETREYSENDEVLYEESTDALKELEEELNKIKNFNKNENTIKQDEKIDVKETDVKEDKEVDKKESTVKGDEISKISTEQDDIKRKKKIRITEGELPVTMTDEQPEQNTGVITEQNDGGLLPNYDSKLYK